MAAELALRLEAPSVRLKSTLRATFHATVADLLAAALKQASVPGDQSTYGLARLLEGALPNERFYGPLTVNGVWLDPTRTVQQCNVRNNDLLLLKRLPADLFVVTPDGDMRPYKLDLYATVEDILTELCSDLDLKRPEDYSLEASDVLSRELSAYAQNVRPGSKCTLRPRRTALTLARSVSSRLMLGADKLRTKLDVLSIVPPAQPVAVQPIRSARSSLAMFGVPLDDAIDLPSCPYNIPSIVERAIQYLEAGNMDVEGIFRLSGSAALMQQHRDRCDRGEDVDFSSVTDPHAVAGLLKLYLRELPEPLLTYPLFGILGAVAKQVTLVADPALKARYYRAVLAALPLSNYLTLRRLMGFLSVLATHSVATKMGSVNLAMVVGPNILRQENESLVQSLENSRIVGLVTDDFIQHFAIIFETIPTPSEVPFVQAMRALDAYTARASSELSFPAEALIFLRNATASADGWLDGEYNGAAGRFPIRAVEPALSLLPPPPRTARRTPTASALARTSSSGSPGKTTPTSAVPPPLVAAPVPDKRRSMAQSQSAGLTRTPSPSATTATATAAATATATATATAATAMIPPASPNASGAAATAAARTAPRSPVASPSKPAVRTPVFQPAAFPMADGSDSDDSDAGDLHI